MATTKGRMAVLAEYFGKHPGQSLKDFSEELKQLTYEERVELSVAAAEQLGLTQEEVSFSIK